MKQYSAEPPQLSLRPFEAQDEAAARTAHRTLLREGFHFLLDHRGGESWHGYLARLDRLKSGSATTGPWVQSTLLAAFVGDELVGRASIRHRLNDWLSKWGGHIGYVVVPEHRRRGYATEILRQSLVITQSMGIDEVLVTCDLSNIGSAKVIEACGGRLESVIDGPDGGEPKRRYWIR